VTTEASADDTVRLTDRIRQVLLDLLSSNTPRAQSEISRATGIPLGTIGALIARVDGWGWLDRTTTPGAPRSRPIKLTADGAEAARAALLADSNAPRPPRHTRPQAPRQPREHLPPHESGEPAYDGRVWTLTELKADVAAGREPQALLDAARASFERSRRT
jgi:DNA-binding MarR family transcriptional regulator